MSEEQFGAGKEPGEQGSVDWLMSRVGHATCSRYRDVLDELKSGKPGAKRSAYEWEIVIETITQTPAQHYESAAMQHGTDTEPFARMHYESRTGNIVSETGFLHHPTIKRVGGSPDGLVDEDGGLEIKCPFNSANHLACFLNGMPEDHMAQIQGLMWITGRKWWDFVSYDPRLPEPLDMYVERIERDEKYIANLQEKVIGFLVNVDAILLRLNVRGGTGIPPEAPTSSLDAAADSNEAA